MKLCCLSVVFNDFKLNIWGFLAVGRIKQDVKMSPSRRSCKRNFSLVLFFTLYRLIKNIIDSLCHYENSVVIKYSPNSKHMILGIN